MTATADELEEALGRAASMYDKRRWGLQELLNLCYEGLGVSRTTDTANNALKSLEKQGVLENVETGIFRFTGEPVATKPDHDQKDSEKETDSKSEPDQDLPKQEQGPEETTSTKCPHCGEEIAYLRDGGQDWKGEK